ncbi:MAG: methylenetetrahydrofolate reductase, partial [Planctomycetes bacterium]|nr:methylenetetrahydrofolate reductase [Planctomycetota bacterium]
PEYLAQNAVRLAKLGVRLLGGCCGTRPETIRAISMALTTIRKQGVYKPTTRRVTSQYKKPATFKNGAFLDGIKRDKPIIAEIDPPSHLQIKEVMENIRLVAEAGADAVSLAENPLAMLKMGNIALASKVKQELEIPTICHLTCRDRNLLGLQSALMGAHILNIDAILAITGDPVQSHGSGSTGRSVYDVNSVGLVRLLAGLNRGVTSTGVDLKGETNFSIGVAFNSCARNLESEVNHLKKKVDEGARFIMTQPVFDVDHGKRVLKLTRATGLRVFLGFFPLVSARSALYLHNEVPGISIPEEVLKSITSREKVEDQEKAGIEICRNLLEELLPELDGVYLISPFNRAGVLAPLIRMVCAARQ